MLKKTIICGLSITLLCACQKKNNNTPATSAPASTTTGATPTLPSFYGFLTAGSYSTVINSYTSSGAQATAYFSSAAVQARSLPTGVKVGQVALNGDTLAYNLAPYPANYYQNWRPVNLVAGAWSVVGANGIPSFNFQDTSPLPSFVVTSIIPDTISKAAGFSVTINNMSNATRAQLYVYDGASNYVVNISIPLTGGNNQVNVTASQLSSALTTGTMASIGIAAENTQTATIGGKDFKFSKETQLSRHVKIVP